MSGGKVFGDFQLEVNGRKIKNAATLAGECYSTATGDPQGAVFGRLLDGVTDLLGIDVVYNVNTGGLAVKAKPQPETK